MKKLSKQISVQESISDAAMNDFLKTTDSSVLCSHLG